MVATEIWIQVFESKPITEKRLKDEIDDVLGTISNERLWERGAKNLEELRWHQENLICLTEYLNYLYKLWNEKYKEV